MSAYFAYGSNMDPDQMGRRCAGATLDGVATLRGHRFVVTRAGYASVLPDPNGVVHGVVWRLAEADERALDLYERVPERQYRKEQVLVQPLGAGSPLPALIYVGEETESGTPQPGYMETVIRAARRHGFPQAYLAELGRWLPSGRS